MYSDNLTFNRDYVALEDFTENHLVLNYPVKQENACLGGSPNPTNPAPNQVVSSPILNCGSEATELDETNEDLNTEGLTQNQLLAFANELRKKRLSLGYTQADVGRTIGHLTGHNYSQTTICRFESGQLKLQNMQKLWSPLNKFMEEMNKNKTMDQVLSDGQTQPQVPRRKRTTINKSSKGVLESYFYSCQMPSRTEIARLASELELPAKTIQTWFCNRRQKNRREPQSASDDLTTPMQETQPVANTMAGFPAGPHNPAFYFHHPYPGAEGFHQGYGHMMNFGGHSYY